MRFERMIYTIDTHTSEELTRTVLGGFLPFLGKAEAKKCCF